MVNKVEEIMILASVHVPDGTRIRVVRHEGEGITSVRFGGDESFVLELDDGMVPVLADALLNPPERRTLVR